MFVLKLVMKVKEGSFSHSILSAIYKASEAGVFDLFSYSAQLRYLRTEAGLESQKKPQLSKYIKRMIENGILEYDNEGAKKSAIKLSTLGKEFLGLEEEWDGIYRIVVWDIPENKRRLRDLLRRKLKEWKFEHVQKSVWVSKRNVTVRLRSLVKELEMGDWVIVIESEDKCLAQVIKRT